MLVLCRGFSFVPPYVILTTCKAGPCLNFIAEEGELQKGWILCPGLRDERAGIWVRGAWVHVLQSSYAIMSPHWILLLLDLLLLSLLVHSLTLPSLQGREDIFYVPARNVSCRRTRLQGHGQTVVAPPRSAWSKDVWTRTIPPASQQTPAGHRYHLCYNRTELCLGWGRQDKGGEEEQSAQSKELQV